MNADQLCETTMKPGKSNLDPGEYREDATIGRKTGICLNGR